MNLYMYSRLPIYRVPIYRVSLFTVHRFVPLNKVFYIKNVLNVSRFTVHPDIPCIFPFPQKHGKSEDDCIAFSKVPRTLSFVTCSTMSLCAGGGGSVCCRVLMSYHFIWERGSSHVLTAATKHKQFQLFLGKISSFFSAYRKLWRAQMARRYLIGIYLVPL